MGGRLVVKEPEAPPAPEPHEVFQYTESLRGPTGRQMRVTLPYVTIQHKEYINQRWEELQE